MKFIFIYMKFDQIKVPQVPANLPKKIIKKNDISLLFSENKNRRVSVNGINDFSVFQFFFSVSPTLLRPRLSVFFCYLPVARVCVCVCVSVCVCVCSSCPLGRRPSGDTTCATGASVNLRGPGQTVASVRRVLHLGHSMSTYRITTLTHTLT